MNIFIKRIYQAENPSKKEKHLRKIAFILILDITTWFLPIEAVTKAFEPYHIEIVRAESVYAREQEEQYPVRLTAETVPQTDGVQVTHDGETSPVSLIRRIAQEEGIDWKILYAIGEKESQYRINRVGDTHLKNYSYGYFQINRGYHPEVTIAQANDLEWSARWTAKRLKKNELRGERDMILSHNGLVGDRDGDGEIDNIKYYNDVYRIIETL